MPKRIVVETLIVNINGLNIKNLPQKPAKRL